MTSTWRKLMPIVLFFCSPVWAQSGSTSTLDSDSKPQVSDSPQNAPDSSQKTRADQTPATLPPDSTKLEAIKTIKAVYPEEARADQRQGQVWVKILVSETGDVESVDVISGDPVLGKSAVDAAKKWKFKPFVRNGKPVEVSTKLDFNFSFSENTRDEKAAPAAASAAVKGDAPQRVRISQGVSAGLLVHKVQPVYPREARQDRIQGTVVLRAVINKEGRIQDLQLISGPKELAPAAIGAVQQWRYRPYLLMGNPVEVDTEILVNFQLW